MSYDTARPYIACFLLLTREDGKVAFVLRDHVSWMSGYYGLPSGKVEKDESYTAGAIRETKEEAGVDIALEDLQYIHTMHRTADNDTLSWVDVYFKVTKWEGEAYNAEPHVHSELTWFDLDKLPENVVPPVRAALQAIKAGKCYTEYGW
jgi:8-oxo-dGTP pyrophosphatase MutT (NUDIX family)